VAGNPIQKAGYYRRRLVARCGALTYLDTAPVEELEKCGAAAWAAGGRGLHSSTFQLNLSHF